MRVLLIAMLLTTPTQLFAFEEGKMGIPRGYYTYQGKCNEIFDSSGELGRMTFIFDGKSLNSAQSSCQINAIDFISAGYLNVITKCVDNKTGIRTEETYTMLPDQGGKLRIKLYATYVNGKLTNQGNPDWFYLCKPLEPTS